MKLDINLYQDEFRTAFRPFGLSTLVVLLALLLLGGALWRVAISLEARAVANELDQRTAEMAQLRQEIDDLSARLGSDEEKRRVQQRITQLRDGIARREQLLAEVSIENGVAGRLPSVYLEGVARQTADGIWLNRLAVDHRTDRVEIRGHATDPALVPAFVGRLGEEAAFRDERFRRLTMNRNADRPDWVDFHVMTSEGGADGD